MSASASTGRADIVSPGGMGSAKSIEVRAGEVLSATVSLILPLTPPPGVQQPKIWDGWSVRISRKALVTAGGASDRMEYPCRVLRIRPAPGGTYKVTALVLPWVPRGLYDLEIVGPGFRDTEPGAVRVLADGGVATGGCSADVTIPSGWAGAKVSDGKSLLVPSEVSLRKIPRADGSADRVLLFDVDGEDCEEIAERLVVESVEDTGRLEAEIKITPENSKIDPIKWYALSLALADPSREPRRIIWSFGDGEWGEGRAVRHRWIFDESVEVRALVLDGEGRAFAFTKTLEMAHPLSRDRGCGCGEIGWVGRGTSFAGLLLRMLNEKLLSVLPRGE